MVEAIEISASLREQLAQEARNAFPRECCGLVEGVREGAIVRIVRLHATRNLVDASDRFEIDPKSQFALMRALRGTGREVVGCYHSHPNGRAEPSARDLAEAGEMDFVWLIVAVAGEVSSLDAHVFDGQVFRRLRLTETPCA